MTSRILPFFTVVLALIWTASPVVQADALRNAVDSEQRTAKNAARDGYRNPYETLMFFEISPDMTVVEINPGKSLWYMEILAPYLKESGRYYAASYDKDSQSEYIRNSYHVFTDNVAKRPDLFDKVETTVFAPPHKLAIAPPASADRVLTFRNVHNWMKYGGIKESFQAFYDVLKPGGILGVVEHRASTDKPQDPKALNGYVRQDYVIALAEEIGFEFVASSEVNANPKDTKDYEKGVWSLPPVLRSPEELKAERLAIGESDRMTLKFAKPENN